MDVKREQFLNAAFWMRVRELGNVTEVNAKQSLKALDCIVTTELGITTEVNVAHPENAENPTEVTLYVIPLSTTVLGKTSAPT